MMTGKQEALYWREWGAVSRAAKAQGLAAPDRHELHAQALGVATGGHWSHKDFTNGQFDLVLGVFRAFSRPSSVDAQLRQIQQPETRKMGRLEELRRCLALYVGDAETYVAAVCNDKFGTPFVEDLGVTRPAPGRPSQREGLLMTLAARLDGRTGFRKRAGHSVHDMRIKAGLQCSCRICVPRVQMPRNVDPPDEQTANPF